MNGRYLDRFSQRTFQATRHGDVIHVVYEHEPDWQPGINGKHLFQQYLDTGRYQKIKEKNMPKDGRQCYGSENDANIGEFHASLGDGHIILHGWDGADYLDAYFDAEQIDQIIAWLIWARQAI